MASTLEYKDFYTTLSLFSKTIVPGFWIRIQPKYNAKLSIQSHNLFLPQEIMTH